MHSEIHTYGEKSEFRAILDRIGKILESDMDRDKKLKLTCKLLRENIEHYDWVGFYFVNSKNRNELVLGPFSGEPTEHRRIKFGEGICGQAAEKRDVFIVQDVSMEENYLSCSPDVRSEIVVPIFKKGEIIGELDIDSHRISAFTENDREFLEKICGMLSRIL